MNHDWSNIQRLDEVDWNNLCAYLQGSLLDSHQNEIAITALRAELLALVSNGLTGGPRFLELLSSLAIFCQDSDFVFAVSPKETEQLAHLSPGRSVAEDLIVGCYRTVGVDELPIADIERLRPIADNTSVAVQKMYEENPYPRWKDLPIFEIDETEKNVLIAGCGSGRHILATAAASPRSRFIGIDLSLASLAYGLLKSREYGIGNVRLIQCDILDVAQLGLTFDHISAVGSIHHMQDPVRGVRALAGVLNSGGTLKLALYSKTGRRRQLAGIALRRELGIPPTPEGIREFRQVIYGLPSDHPAKGVTNYTDFYSISGCRDLLFHVQEHNYTIPEIFELIAASGLRLQTFQVPKSPTDVELTCESLTKLEQTYPGFGGDMFRFVLTA